MEYILTPDEMRKADETAIKEIGIPGEILMENAARSASDYIDEFLLNIEIPDPEVLIICGSGNNGGDGFALARHLHEMWDIRILWIGDENKMSPESSMNFKVVNNLGIQVDHVESEEEVAEYDFNADCIIDAMLGVGGSENLRGLILPIVQASNDSDGYRIAIDVPTGLNAETGAAHLDCFKADMTVTMFAIKSGMLRNEGPDVCGDINVVSLGAPESIVDDLAKICVLEDFDLDLLIPQRERVSSKFDYGRVMVISGSNNMPGAAALVSNSAITSGAGLVYMFSTMVHSATLPEIIPTIVPATDTGSISKLATDAILKMSDKVQVAAIGPGLTDNPETTDFVKEVIEKLPEDISLIIDADGLRAVDKDTKLRRNVILTPHTGEFSRMTGIPREEIEQNTHALAKEWANKLGCIILLKYVPSIITDGEFSYWNINGNPGMASAGSGDVLTGLISALLAQGVEPLESAAFGSFIHALAGDWYADNYGEVTLTASQMLNALRIVLSNGFEEEEEF